MRLKQKKIYNFLSITAFFIIIFFVFNGANCTISELVGVDPKTLDKNNVAETIRRLSEFMVAGASTVALIYMLVGGIQYMLAVGNSQKTTQAVATLTWAVFGFILIIASYIIVTYVIGRVG